MQVVRLHQLVRRVTLIQRTPTGAVTPITLCVRDRKKRRRKKKQRSSGPLRSLEMIAERLNKAQKAFAETFSDRFKSSQRKKRDRWLQDMGTNFMKAANKASRKLYRYPD